MKAHVITLFAVFLLSYSTLILAYNSCSVEGSEHIYTKNDGLVEVEDSYCENQWKLWGESSFSGRYLINNESSRNGFPLKRSEYYMRFQGSGLKIFYRQDTWYGDLIVEIDGIKKAVINQKGSVVNQKQFELNGLTSDVHELRLIGSRRTGVITLDAIEIM